MGEKLKTGMAVKWKEGKTLLVGRGQPDILAISQHAICHKLQNNQAMTIWSPSGLKNQDAIAHAC